MPKKVVKKAKKSATQMMKVVKGPLFDTDDIDKILKKMVVATYPDISMLERIIKRETDKWLNRLKKEYVEPNSFKAGVCYGVYKCLYFQNELIKSKPPTYAV